MERDIPNSRTRIMRSSHALRILVLATSVAYVLSTCSMEDDECVFYFNIEHKLTMMDHKTLVYPANGDIYKYDVTNVSDADPYPIDNVITMDGWEKPRLVAAVNGSVPGPDIIVYEGQTVVVHVKNMLRSVGVTMHWHGLHQVGTPWMDGVPYVTQCPIQPGQSFTYRFKAKPRGTFWWHTHMGAQRSMGLFGAFIIREKQQTDVEEHIIQIMDWNHDHDSIHGHMQMLSGVYENRQKWGGTQALDGSFFSLFRVQAGLINGKGRHYDRNTGTSNMAPLTVYPVQSGHKYRFRVIGVGSLYPFRISVDNHVMTVIASDGYDLEPVIAESFIINPGERFDFEITADQPVGNYWVRGITLEKGYAHKAEAILRYSGAPTDDPSTSRKPCTLQDPCLVLNCPFTYYPEENTICRTFDQLKSAALNDPAPPYTMGKFKEFFLNFAFPGITSYPGSVNGRTFDTPDVNPLTQPTEWYSPCPENKCGPEKICKCTYALNIGSGDTVQMVFMNMGRGKGWSHPIHMHGHSFYVIKMGYGQYNQSTGAIGDDNTDIDCRGNPDRKLSFCNDATWSNRSWMNGNIPELELQKPPRKDTIIVPTGGYVVVRIRANNPGIWNMHCHIELHNLDGMQMLLNESFSEVPEAPAYFPECHSFPHSRPPLQQESPDTSTESNTGADDEGSRDDDDTVSKTTFWIAAGILIGLVGLQLILILVILNKLSASKSSSKYSIGQTNNGFGTQ